MKKPDNIPLFKFYKEDGEWKSKINAELLVYFYQTYGLPREIMMDDLEVRLKDKEWTTRQKINDWEEFIESGGVSKDELEELKNRNTLTEEEFINKIQKTLQ